MDYFWPWNFTPFIDFFLLGDLNKHYQLPEEKKIVLGTDSIPSMLEKLLKAKVIMIHGDHFQEWSHFFSRIAEDESIQLPVKLILSFGSDYTFSETNIEAFANLYPLARFWIQNWCGNLEQVELLPIGFDNNAGKITIDPSIIQKKYTVVISSFTINSVARKEFCSYLDKYPQLASICAPFYGNKNEFFTMLASHYFSICCAGNGFDTYRFWESIHAKCVAIVLRSEFTSNLQKHYPNLPMILLDSWEDLIPLLGRLNKEYYNTFWEKANINFATNHYWLTKLSELVNTP